MLRPLDLGSQLDICLIDVSSGSDTRVMVRQVLDWSTKAATAKDSKKPFQDISFKKLRQLYASLYSELADKKPI